MPKIDDNEIKSDYASNMWLVTATGESDKTVQTIVEADSSYKALRKWVTFFAGTKDIFKIEVSKPVVIS